MYGKSPRHNHSMLMKHLEARQYVLLPCRILSTFFDGNFLNFPNIVLLREISKVLIELFIVSRLRECKGNFEGILYDITLFVESRREEKFPGPYGVRISSRMPASLSLCGSGTAKEG